MSLKGPETDNANTANQANDAAPAPAKAAAEKPKAKEVTKLPPKKRSTFHGGQKVKVLDDATAKIVMDKYDSSKDGRLDMKELEKLCKDFCGKAINDADIKSCLGLCDIDGSKHIELKEVGQVLRSLDIFIKEDTQTYLDAIWKKYDTDRSNMLEKSEIGNILMDMSGRTPTGKEIDHVLRHVSRDGDLDITKFEFTFVLAAWYAMQALEHANDTE